MREAELYAEAGMEPIYALRATTIAPARIRALRAINFVVKTGQVVCGDKGRIDG